MTTKQRVIYNFIKESGASASVRQVIDFCKSDIHFKNKYAPEAAKQIYSSLIANGVLSRTDDILKIEIKTNELF
jgi:hypothetical protein